MDEICWSASMVLRDQLTDMVDVKPEFDKQDRDFLEHCIEELSNNHKYIGVVEALAESRTGMISKYHYVKEVPTNIEYVCALYEGVHSVLKYYDVPVYVYLLLGQNFHELGKRPDFDVEKSVLIGIELYKKNPDMLLCWEDKTCYDKNKDN